MESESLVYKSFGDPRKVLELVTVPVPSPGPRQVLIKWLAAPINPLDVNRIQGAYVYREELPAIGGSEGVGRVIQSGVGSSFKEGDHVTLFSQQTPFWTQYGLADDDDLFKLDNRIDIATAATFMVNPPTAWIMLRHFVELQKGDYIIQNSANSGVGRNVIQLCKAWGLKSINIVRDRKDIGQLKTQLWKLGADHVFTEEEFASDGKRFIKTLANRPRLALNGVGGRSVLAISSTLERGGTCIVYGGMSKRPHEFSTSALVFNDIRVRGIAVGMWMREPENQDTFQNCMQDLQKLAVDGIITAPPMDQIYIGDFKNAMERTMTGKNKKQLFLLHKNVSKL